MKVHLAALTLLHDLSTRLLAVDGLEPLFQEIMDAAVAMVKAERGTLQLVEGESLRIVAHHGHQPPFLKFFAAAEAQASVCGEALKHGERVIVEDVEHSPLFVGTASAKVLRDAGVRAVQSTPLRTRRGRLVGILTTQWSVPHVPDEHDLWLIDLLARQAADLTEHKQTEEGLCNANEDLRARAEQLQTANEMLLAKQQELEEANDALVMQEEDLRCHAEALQANQERLALAASGTQIGIYEWNVRTGETLWTEQVERLLDLRPTTTLSQPHHYHDWADRIHPEDRARVEAELRRCMAERTPHELEYRIVWPDGSMHWVASRGVAQYDPDGCCTRLLGIVMDITDRKQAEEALRENEALMHAVMEQSPDLIYMKDLDARVLMVNPAMCKALGRPAKDVIGHNAREFHRDDPEVGRAILENDRRIMKSGQMETVEELGPKGRTYLSTKAPHRDVAGNIIGLIGISHDITERKQAEEALRESEERFRKVFDNAAIGILIADANRHYHAVNDRFCEMMGRSRDELLTSGCGNLLHPDDQAGDIEDVGHLLRGEVSSFTRDMRYVRSDGAIVWVRVNVSRLPSREEDSPRLIAIMEDITERKRAEEALRELNATLENKVSQRTAELASRAKQL